MTQPTAETTYSPSPTSMDDECAMWLRDTFASQSSPGMMSAASFDRLLTSWSIVWGAERLDRVVADFQAPSPLTGPALVRRHDGSWAMPFYMIAADTGLLRR